MTSVPLSRADQWKLASQRQDGGANWIVLEDIQNRKKINGFMLFCEKDSNDVTASGIGVWFENAKFKDIFSSNKYIVMNISVPDLVYTFDRVYPTNDTVFGLFTEGDDTINQFIKAIMTSEEIKISIVHAGKEELYSFVKSLNKHEEQFAEYFKICR
ncbi:MAG: hypothetical protein WD673_03125 [Alphaproteobacteria bacterium]